MVESIGMWMHTPKVIKVSLLWQGRMLIDKECKPVKIIWLCQSIFNVLVGFFKNLYYYYAFLIKLSFKNAENFKL